MELGLVTFADVGSAIGPQERLRNLMEEVRLADELGLDVFGVGEHHRPDFAVSAPAVVLAAAAVQTERIRLASAVTVLSSDDPVRVFEEFSTVDLVSGGRAEIWAGRGSFTESFPLFGYDLEDYDELFAEKLELLLALRSSERVTWSGRHRAPLNDSGVWPRPVQDPLPVWLAVGGTPGSFVRAGTLGLPLAINTHAFVADDQRAFAPSYMAMMSRIGRERGWPPMTRRAYLALRSPRGALAAGSPGEVAEKILFEHELFGHQRYLAQMAAGEVAHADVMRSIERFGTEVAPLVRSELERRAAA
jgi:alkanesulfonate monooxygenase SsuD/methylene tetrahydromethanopterin reductase-like flavin-dependent oxidoreductase (luciferase family)